MVVVGIDPDLSGGVVTVNPQFLEIINVARMPVLLPKGPKKERKRVDAAGLWKELMMARKKGAQYVILESAIVRPQVGKGGQQTMMGSIGPIHQNYGAIRALCELAFTPSRVMVVSPAVWKKALGLGSDKKKSRTMAIEKYPDHATLLGKVKNTGIAEALLLAEYGSERTYKG